MVEVTLAIGIIAFAFVALFGLLPTGLSTFRSAIDTSNETWIMQNMNSMVQTTDFALIEGLDHKNSREIFYFDEEGKLTDSERNKGSDDVQRTRLYAVKLVIDQMNRPDGSDSPLMKHGWRVITVFAAIADPRAMEDFGKVESAATLTKLPKQTNVRNRTFFVARMDSE